MRLTLRLRRVATATLGIVAFGASSSLAADPVCPETKVAAGEIAPVAQPDSSRRTAAVGAIEGRFNVSEEGGATYTMPIAVPPGRLGVEPKIFLHYDSNSREGTLGAGFSLTGISAITRCAMTQGEDGLRRGVRFDARDRYCLDGAKLVVVDRDEAAGTIEFRTRPDQFKKIVARSEPGRNEADGPQQFQVWSRDGRIATYGADESSRARVGSKRISAWLIASDRDRNGNAVRYEYLNELDVADGHTRRLYLLRIDYTDHPDAPASRRVLFEYRLWDAHPSGFVGGGKVFHDRRLQHIRTQVVAPDGSVHGVRLYQLDYQASAATGRALLQSVRECRGIDDDSCNPPTRFDWMTNKVVLGPPMQQGVTAGDPSSLLMADVTGDGLEDIVLTYHAVAGITTQVVVQINSGDGGYLAPTTWALESGDHIVGEPRATDFDGDGRQDLVFATRDLRQWQVLLAKDGAFLRGNSGIPFSTDVNFIFRLADFDGDGMQDALLCHIPALCHGRCPVTWEVWIGTPLEFKKTAAPFQLDGVPCWEDTKVVDVQGDGKVDILIPPLAFFNDQLCLDGGECNYQTLELDWTSPQVWVASDSGLPVAKSKRTIFVDVNGDGLPDAVQTDDGEPKTFLNTGGGFADPVVAIPNPVPTDQFALDGFLSEARPFDFEGDGNMDLLLPIDDCPGALPCWKLLRASHRGDGTFVVDSSLQLGALPRLAVTDVNGDGRHDLVFEKAGKVSLRRNSGANDLLVAVTDGMNNSDPGDAGFLPNLSISYGNLADTVVEHGFAPGSLAEDEARYVARWSRQANSCDYPRRCVAGAVRVVSGYTLNNGHNQGRHFDVRYRNARTDSYGEGWLGFGARIIRDLDTGAGTAELFDNETYDDRLFAHPFVRRAVETWTWTPALAGEPDTRRIALSYVDDELAVEPTRGSTFFVNVARRESRRLEGNFAPGGDTILSYVASRGGGSAELLAQTTHQSLAVDDRGNIRDELTDTVGVEQVRVERDFHEGGEWLLGLPTNERTCSTAGGVTQCRTETHEYDERGRRRTSTVIGSEGGASQQLQLTRTHDDFGNIVEWVLSDTLGNHRTSCETFDAEGIFPLAHGDPLGHLDYGSWDPRNGAPLAYKDANGLLTRWSYDGFGRLIHTELPTGRELRRHYVRSKDGGPAANWWTTRTRIADDGAPRQVLETDMLGRLVQRSLQAPEVPVCADGCVSGGSLVETHTFDFLGRETRTTGLHHEAFPTAAATTRHAYDALGRPMEERTPWGSVVRFRYDGNRAQATDSAGTVAVLNDAAGRPTEVVDEHGTSTTFAYGPFGLLRETATAGEVTRFGFDSLGRLRTIEDPNRGPVEHTYDAFGDLVATSDALGRRFSSSHDALGRLLSTTSPDGIAKWEWDPAGCVGCLRRSTSADDVITTYTYDGFARAASTTITLDGVDLEARRSYDAADRVTEVVYPDVPPFSRLRVLYQYDGTGWLVRVRQGGSPVPVADFWRLLDVDAWGRLRSSAFANGVTRHVERDAAKGVVTRLLTRRGAVRLQEWSYEYDDRLNPTLRRDHVLDDRETLRYDELDRLVCVAAKPESTDCLLRLRYEDNGNIAFKSDVGRYQYEPLHPHAAVAAGDAAFTYDAVGNQRTRPDLSIEYNDRDLPLQYEAPGRPPTVFAYDAQGQRVRQRDGADETVYFPGLYERSPGAAARHRFLVPLGDGELVFTREPAGTALYYVHGDLVGSTDVVTDGAGAVAERRRFDVFGARRGVDGAPQPDVWSSPTTPHGFSAHETDDAVGLVNMGGRLYDPQLARFLQVDPLVSNLHSSQRWNAYSYVLNSPLKYVDPTGYDPEATAGSTAGATSMPPPDDYDPTAFSLTAGGEMVFPNAYITGAVGSDHQPRVDEDRQPPERVPIYDPPPPPPDPTETIAWGDLFDYLPSIPSLSDSIDLVTPDADTTATLAITGGTVLLGAASLTADLASGDLATGVAEIVVDESGVAEALDLPVNEPKGNIYSTGIQVQIEIDRDQWSRAVGTQDPDSALRRLHNQAANRALLEAIEASDELAETMKRAGVSLERGPLGGVPRRAPPGWIWHHQVDSANLELVPKYQHTPGSIWWRALHYLEGAAGGFAQSGRNPP